MEDFFILAIVGSMLLIPIVAILTHHQRKMAEIVHKEKGEEILPALMQEVQLLRQEVQSMRSEINANTIAVDSIKQTTVAKREHGNDLEHRVSE